MSKLGGGVKRKLEVQSNPIKDGILNWLETLELKGEDFKSPRGRQGLISHQRVVDGILDVWRQTKGFGRAWHTTVTHAEELGIDFIGKEWGGGKILLAVEVDTRHQATGSWRKLSDIRTENRVWVYLTKAESEAERNFADAIELIKVFLRDRGETRDSYGELVAVLRTPSEFKVEVVTPAN